MKSRAALKLLVDVQANQPELWLKITTRRFVEDDDPTESPHLEGEDFNDDISVPLEAVVAHISSPESSLQHGVIMTEDGSLMTENASEVFEHETELTAPAQRKGDVEVDELGRGKRRKVPNHRYNEFWQQH